VVLDVQTAQGSLVTAFDTDGIIQTNPSSGSDVIYSIAVDSNYLYAAGYDNAPGNYQWRIEKRDITTGALVSGFGTSGVVQNNPSSGIDMIYSIAVDSNYLYAAGYDNAPGNYQWRIEKRDITTGALVSGFGTSGVVQNNPSSGIDMIYSIAVDSNYIYAAGRDRVPGNSQWRIEKRDITTGALVSGFGTDGVIQVNPATSDLDDAYSVKIDSNYIYIAGNDWGGNACQWRIEKRDITTGALVSGFGTDGVVLSDPSTGEDRLHWESLAVDSDYIYIAGEDWVPGNFQWRIEKRDITTGALVSGFGTDGVIQVNPSASADYPYSVKIDSSYIYLAGADAVLGGSNFQWRIEKRDITTGALVSGFGTDGVIQINQAQIMIKLIPWL
jgi:formylmethanofuran dehydrogenase subunit C